MPSKPIEATVNPMIDPPKKATLRAAAAPFVLAATAVLTLAFVAEQTGSSSVSIAEIQMLSIVSLGSWPVSQQAFAWMPLFLVAVF